MLPFPPRVLAKEYLAINPLGTISFMIDGETRMTESAAICHYLGTRYGPTQLVVGVDEPAYGAFLNWLSFGEATLTFPQTLVLRYGRLEPQERRSPQVAEDYAKWFLGRLRAVEAALGQAPMLCAGRFTAADISVATRCGLPRTSIWPRISARTSRPTGSVCSSATATPAPRRRKIWPRSSRISRRNPGRRQHRSSRRGNRGRRGAALPAVRRSNLRMEPIPSAPG